MEAITIIINKINFLDNKILILLLVVVSMLFGLALLYSPNLTVSLFLLISIPTITLAEPFIGAMIYLICLYVRPLEIISTPINMPMMYYFPLMKILAILALVSWFLKIILNRKITFVKAQQNLLMFVFYAILIASNRTYVNGALMAFSEFFKIFVIYFLLINLITTERRLKATIWILILCTVYLSIQGILLSKGISIGNVSVVEEGRVRGSGIFNDPNDLAMSLIVIFPFIFYFFFSERFILKRVILLLFVMAILYCIFLTGSRGGMIALSVVMYLLLRKKTGNIVGAILVLICVVGFLFIAPSHTVERFRNVTSQDDTGYGRIMLWRYGFGLFLHNPFTGIGMNNFAEYNEYVAHNSFVHVATETGIIGLLSWIGLFYFSFKNLFKIKNTEKGSGENSIQTMTSSSKVSLIGFIVCGLFISRQYNYIPYILIALSVCISKIYNSQENDTRILTKDIIRIVGISFAFILWWFAITRTVS